MNVTFSVPSKNESTDVVESSEFGSYLTCALEKICVGKIFMVPLVDGGSNSVKLYNDAVAVTIAMMWWLITKIQSKLFWPNCFRTIEP